MNMEIDKYKTKKLITTNDIARASTELVETEYKTVNLVDIIKFREYVP
jgi:hypothetical protein